MKKAIKLLKVEYNKLLEDELITSENREEFERKLGFNYVTESLKKTRKEIGQLKEALDILKQIRRLRK